MNQVANNQYLDALLYIFKNHSKLENYFTEEYVNVESQILHIEKLKQLSKTWSTNEKFMLDLALNLFGIQGKIDLNMIDYLDQDNKQIAIEALKIRFQEVLSNKSC